MKVVIFGDPEAKERVVVKEEVESLVREVTIRSDLLSHLINNLASLEFEVRTARVGGAWEDEGVVGGPRAWSTR